MGAQQPYRGFLMALIAVVAFAFTPTLSSAPAKKPESEPYTLFESGQVRPLRVYMLTSRPAGGGSIVCFARRCSRMQSESSGPSATLRPLRSDS